ncbi:39360_t:CDS:1, partial [Gigaspora margarita]
MPKETSIKATQKKKAQVARSARVSYSLIDLASSEEYFDSNDDSDESSDDNFMELEDPDEIIRLLTVSPKKKTALLYISEIKTFREAAVRSLKISDFFSNNQQLAADNDESSRDFQDQNDQ